MVAAEVQFYDVVVWLHVTSVVLAFGPTFAFGIYLTIATRRHPRSIPAILEAQCLVSRTMVTIGGLVILASGIYLAADRWEFSDFFIVAGLIAIVILLGLANLYFLPHDNRARAAAERDIEAAGPTGEVQFGEEFTRASAASARMGPVAGLIVVVTIYFMATKPFL
jgi:hypothetical protein